MQNYYMDPNEFQADSDSRRIQLAVNAAAQSGCNKVVIPCYNVRTGKNLWEIDESILLPSHMYIEINNAHLRMKDGVYCQMFRNSLAFDETGTTEEGLQEDIIIQGVGRALLDGGLHNGLREKTSLKNGLPSIIHNLTIYFHNVRNFKIDGLTIRDQRWWAIMFCFAWDGIVSNIRFEITDKSVRESLDHPWRNQDGIDLRVGCHDIQIFNLTGETCDDVVALTALNGFVEEPLQCPHLCRDIYNVDIRNIMAFDNHCFLDMLPLIEQYGKYYVEMRDRMDSASDRANLETYGIDPSTGALYAMPAYQVSASMDMVANHVMINQAWLDAIGEDVPTTVDELVNVLTKFINEDPNGNGVKDEMGMVGNIGRTRGNILEYVINAYVYCNDNYRFNIGADGELYLPYTTDEYRQALIKLNEMYANGLIVPVSFTLKDDSETMAIFTPADGVSLAGVVAGHPVLITADDSENCFDYVGLPALEAETELGGYEASQSATFTYCTYITEDCENPELAFKLLDFMYSEESFIRQRYGNRGVHWDYCPEGTVDENGDPLLFYIYDGSIFAGQNNSCWHVIGCCIFEWPKLNMEYKVEGEEDGDGELSWAERKSEWTSELYEVWKASPKNDNAFYRNVYNAEENEAITAYNTTFLQYVEEARALFVTGTMDPSNDNDWNQYLSNLEAEGMSDLLASARSAYNRMNGK